MWDITNASVQIPIGLYLTVKKLENLDFIDFPLGFSCSRVWAIPWFLWSVGLHRWHIGVWQDSRGIGWNDEKCLHSTTIEDIVLLQMPSSQMKKFGPFENYIFFLLTCMQVDSFTVYTHTHR